MPHDPGRTFGTQHALVDRMIRVTFDVSDLAVFEMHADPAAAGAHIACGGF